PGDRVMIEGQILQTKLIPGRRASLVTTISDETGVMTLRFFHFNATQRQRLMEKGQRLCCFGEVRAHYRGGFEMVHPEYREITEDTVIDLSDRLTAIYPTTKGLHQVLFRKLMAQVFSQINIHLLLEELLPEPLLEKMHYPSLYAALDYVHRPPPDADLASLEAGVHPAQQRLAFEELLAHHLSLQLLRAEVRQDQAPALKTALQLKQRLLAALPFQLTNAQQRVVTEIESDLVSSEPMLRLVQGDVGSGKTIVAAIAVAQAVEADYQAAVMAPTEILAEQHFQKFKEWFEPLGLKVGWLSGQLTVAERRPILEDLMLGKIQIVVGTHALFQKEVQFQKLALLVIDEQHRFGVHQRLALKEKGVLPGQQPHQLIMTATPIPRTLAMTAYADLDFSVIDELPPGRKPIKTILVSNTRRDEVMQRVKANGEKGCQAYWVCTLIEESEALQCQAAEEAEKQLKAELTTLNVGLIHGRMKADQKESVMQQFKRGELDLLVATTVVEVGVDVPNANLMIIENPERLGLAQLHQLRGRVGRGDIASHCVLLYQLPLSEATQRRLEIMRETQDGFALAEADLEIRGPGEVLGTKQAGVASFRVANILRDQRLLNNVKQISFELQKNASENVKKLIQRWIGARNQYFHV
ncbi:MAG: ATP-dependent DNA helicase RecG, partial [Coxiellaceae bacterium]|nr:ATP-dependent DNA helicase RecG [Coxiellaceae bacterium]